VRRSCVPEDQNRHTALGMRSRRGMRRSATIPVLNRVGVVLVRPIIHAAWSVRYV
jgi:hypothetical protein